MTTQVIKREHITCPECNFIQPAEVTHTEGHPWQSYVHHCVKCGYIITESEWEPVKQPEQTRWTNEQIDAACVAEFITGGLRLMKTETAAAIMRRMREELTAERDQLQAELHNAERKHEQSEADKRQLYKHIDALTAERDQLQQQLKLRQDLKT